MSTDGDHIEHDIAENGRGVRWRRRLARTGTALLVFGLLGAGATFGWYLRGWLPSGGVGVKVTKVVVNRPLQVEGAAVTNGTLPNVLGLGESEARQAYQDAGVNPSALEVERTPFVADPGSVVKQVPPAASAVPKAPARPKLIVAQPATMPDLVGLTADAARAKLDAIGAGATTDVRYDPSVQPGQVAQSDPAAGRPATPRVTLLVSEEASSVDLTDLQPVAGDCRTGDTTVRGADVTDAVLCDASATPVRVEYAINDKVTAFEAELGLADGHPVGTRVRLIVRRDGHAVGSFTTRGAPVQVKVPVNGGKTLSLEIDATGDQTVTAALSDARIVGARSGIDELMP